MPENLKVQLKKKDTEQFGAIKSPNKNTYIRGEHSKPFFADNQKVWGPLQ